MRSLLVTGGAGFIGGNFVHYWTRHHAADRIVVLDALTYAGNRATLSDLITTKRIEFIHGDIGDRPLVDETLQRCAIDTIVHFAAESHVDRSIADPGAFVRTNVVGTQILLDAATSAWCVRAEWKAGVRFHHVSTDEVYGSLSASDPAFTEVTPYAPNSPYAASKAGADHLVRAYAHTYGLPASISNCSNNYGPFQFPEKLIPLMIVNALRGLPLPVYGDGQQIRDWLYVEDHCAAIARILLSDVAGETFNVGGGAERFNIEIVRTICGLLDERLSTQPALAAAYPECPAANGGSTSALLTHVADRPGHDRRYAIDSTRIAAKLSFRPAHTLATGLRHTVDWYLSNEDWWAGVLRGSHRV